LFLHVVSIPLSLLSLIAIFFSRIDECKDKIRGVLKGRLPPDKDLKKEITQTLRLFYSL
jgi:hypothetical protein